MSGTGMSFALGDEIEAPGKTVHHCSRARMLIGRERFEESA